MIALPPVTQTHPAANIADCMALLADLFPGMAEYTDAQLYDWKLEFAGRPAGLCADALHLYHRTEKSHFPKILEFVERVQELARSRAPRAATPVERTEAYLADQNRAATEAEDGQKKLCAWVESLDPERREKLKSDAIDALHCSPTLRAKWMAKDPTQKPGLAALMFEEHRRQNKEKAAA